MKNIELSLCIYKLCDPDAPDRRVRLHVQQLSGARAMVPKSSNLQTQEKIPLPILGSGSTTTADQAPARQNSGNERFTEFASSAGEVSGFVKAVVNRVIPNDFFGSEENKMIVIRMVDRFVKLRRYESFSLHDAIQGLKVCLITRHHP